MGEDITDVIHRSGNRDEIAIIHFRDVIGTTPKFHETFVDTDNVDTADVVRALRDVRFNGRVISDHVLKIEVTMTGGTEPADLRSDIFPISSILFVPSRPR